RPSSPKPVRVAVLNKDDASCARLQRLISGAQVATFGFGEGADFRACGDALTLEGATFRLSHAGRESAIRVRLIGRHNLRNALGAAAAAWSLGLPEAGIIEGLAALKRVPGRLEPVEAGQGFSVFVDYAHTEDALVAVLDCLRSLTRGRILTVFGCGGERDAGKRGPMGAAAAAGSDLAIATSDNPRGEDPLEILRQIEEGIRLSKRENYRIVPDRQEAVFEAVRLAQPGDVVLIAGKGHEDAQILGARAVRFDDREVALTALKDSGKC
ncbi:MAG: cyanophycin synthetase, partial [Elusimicrobiota bacterium]